MTYFATCETVEDIKATYRVLVRKHHPDLAGGDLETMKVINAQYEAALKGSDGQQSMGTDNKTHTYRYDAAVEAELMEKISELISLIGDNAAVEILLIGRWIWITGETKPLAPVLGKKGAGCFWNSTRVCWYWKSKETRSYGRGGNLDELAAKYGCQTFKGKASKKVKAAA
jgi:hypothetical protein